MTESEANKLAKLRDKIAQMRAQERAIIAKENQRLRKERIGRLIRIGEMVEKHLNCGDISDIDSIESLLKIKLGVHDE